MKERKFTRGREYGMRVRLGRKRKRKKERGSQREGDRVDGREERGEENNGDRWKGGIYSPLNSKA